MLHHTGKRAAMPRRETPLEPALTLVMMAVTLVACAFFARDMVRLGIAYRTDGDLADLARLLCFIGVVLTLVYGNLVYQTARFGHFVRRRQHRPPAFGDLVDARWEAAPPVTILVPSYKEDVRTIRQTLLSAALQHYPDHRVVLLLDDPPHPIDDGDRQRLLAARRVPGEVTSLLDAPAETVRRAAREFGARIEHDAFDPAAERERLRDLYTDLAGWFTHQEQVSQPVDHTDWHFQAMTFGRHETLLRQAAERLDRPGDAGHLGVDRLRRAYSRLTDLFRVEVTCFERKRYRNLSHEANKAANLNSYIDLLGQRVHEVRRPDGLHLEKLDTDQTRRDPLTIPDATYVLTLDADSLIVPDYTLRLVDEMEQPANGRLAVIQSPYTAVPHPPSTLERVAGATTDMQYIVHQGFTRFGATFWVGANALLRKTALDDIRSEEVERGFRVTKYIQDWTVIEDTESTVDLIGQGWWLANYPGRLAYSATPPDFGALLIQRRRWANGGLLVLPKLARYAIRGPWRRAKPVELLMRLHYLGSLFTGSVGLLVLLLLPLEEGLGSVWLPVTAAPYFFLYGRDLLQAGYRRTDLLRVYAFNMMLLPIHLAGVVKSLQQGVTRRKSAFGRTPKVEGRTGAPVWAILSEWLLLAYCLWAVTWDASTGRWGHALFSLVTLVAIGYALAVFVGIRASIEDVSAAMGRPDLSAFRFWRNQQPRHGSSRTRQQAGD